MHQGILFSVINQTPGDGYGGRHRRFPASCVYPGLTSRTVLSYVWAPVERVLFMPGIDYDGHISLM